jgi:hypothetical protein
MRNFAIKNQNKSIFMILLTFLLITTSFSIILSLGAYELGEDPDQVQGDENYGYWFDDTVSRWQEFRPLYSTLSRLDLNVDKIGNPGNMLINITDGQQSLWNTTVLEADIASGATWVNISLESALPLIPERSYYIHVRSDQDYVSADNRYTWDGHLNSNYTRGVSSIASEPNFDFTFVTWSLSNDRDIYLDQVQNGVNYGFTFEDDVIRWQEFKPLHSTLNRLDLYISKYGNPGNMLVNITDSGHRTLWQTTVLEADIDAFGWVNITVDPALPLIPEQSYYIYVGSDIPSPDVDNQFVWRGTTKSNYYRGENSLHSGRPTWDFGFRTWSIPCDIGSYIDQAQNVTNYGFWFDDTEIRWQEFKPYYSSLNQIDLCIGRTGSPGNIGIAINDSTDRLWETTILEANIPIGAESWITVPIFPILPLTPEESYFIYIWSDEDSPTSTNRYSWRGRLNSPYDRGNTSVEYAWSGYDFAFQTWIQSSELSPYIDQAQDEFDYGFVFSNFWHPWQEFKPYHSTLIQLDLYFQRLGDPGDIQVNITDGQNTLWITTIAQADMPAVVGWVSISFPMPLSLIPGASYYIYVRSFDPMVPLNHYYSWSGHTNSNYTRGDTNVQAGHPTYDYAFKTTSLFCDRNTYLDQVQESPGLAVMFEKGIIHWQEFTPVYDTMTRLDLFITNDGDPGNVLVNITEGQEVIWQTMILPSDITIYGWINISVPSAIHLVPGRTYNISVTSDAPSPDVNHIFHWRGVPGASSNYYRGISSIEGSDPGFDFSFRVWGHNDLIPPEIIITNPTNKPYSSSSIWLNFTVDEPTSWIGYSLDGEVNVTISDNILLESLSEGSHNLTIYSTDLAGNTGHFFIDWFAIDTLDPNIELAGPMNVTYTTADIWIDFTIDEPISWIGYSLDGAANVTIPGITLLRSLTEGSHSIVVYARDIVGNTGETNIVWFTIEIPEPEPTTIPPPGTTTEAHGDTAISSTTGPTSATSGESPSGITPGFSFLLVALVVLPVVILFRRKH